MAKGMSPWCPMTREECMGAACAWSVRRDDGQGGWEFVCAMAAAPIYGRGLAVVDRRDRDSPGKVGRT